MALRSLFKDILDIAYTVHDNSTFLVLVKRGAKYKEVIEVPAPFKPYFFIREKDLQRIPQEIKQQLDAEVEIEEVNAITREREKVVKVSVSTPQRIKYWRDTLKIYHIPTYEADIPYVRRFMLDKSISVKQPEKIAAFDIEVDATAGFPLSENPVGRVLAISLFDGKEEIFICEDNEIDMFKKFNKALEQYDFVFGWNSAGFDYPYLLARAKNIGEPIRKIFFQHLDLFGIYMTYFKREETEFKLKTVAQKILGSNVPSGALIDFETPGQIAKLVEFFKERRDILKFYNMDQTKAVYMINEKTGVLQTYLIQNSIAHLLPWHRDLSEKMIAHRKYISYNKIVENLVLKKALHSDPRIVFPSRDEDWSEDLDETESSYAGALVFDPVPGLYSNVVLLDFASMYPRVIMTFNISYDTFTPTPSEKDILAPKGGFITSREGYLPQVLRDLERYRSVAKKLMETYDPESVERVLWSARQFAFKLILVSAYGVAGFKGSRLFQLEIAEDITGYTRDTIQEVKRFIESQGWKVLYGDTDSLFLYKKDLSESSIEKVAQIAQEELLPSLNSYVKSYVINKWRVPSNRVVIEFKVDRIYSKLKLLSVKKRYYGLVGWEDEVLPEPYIQIKGLEARRGDWPELVKEIQRAVIEAELRESPAATKKVIDTYLARLLSGEIPIEKLAIKKHLSKNITDYKSDSPHTRAAKMLLQNGFPVRTGDRIEYIFLDDKVIPLSPGLKLSQSALLSWWKKYVMPVVERLEIQKSKKLF
jgi:DNA polymerase I